MEAPHTANSRKTRAPTRTRPHAPLTPHNRETPPVAMPNTRTTTPPQMEEEEVIIISSDEDEPPHRNSAPKRKTPRSGGSRDAPQNARPAKTRRTVKEKEKRGDDAIELSSEDEKDVEIGRLRKELRDNAEEYQVAFQLCRKETAVALSQGLKSLEDDVGCEICANLMWNPATLPQCGHTFCIACLYDWLDTERQKAGPQAVHPHAGLRISIETLQLYPAIAQMYPELLAQATMPQDVGPYSCPHCRTPITARPIETYLCKHLIHRIAEANSESPPRAGHAASGGVAAAAAVAAGGNFSNIWEKFFPST